MSDWTREGCEKAIRYFSTGLEILGENALLHAGVGNANFRLAHIVPGGMAEHMRAAGDSARRALELDPGLVTGHVLSGLVDWKKGAIGGALRHFRDALETDPDDDEALTWTTWCYATVGDVDFLDRHVQRLLLVDPLDAFTRAVVGLYALYATKLERASEALEQSLSLDSELTFATSLAAFAQLQHGNVEEAQNHLHRLVAGGRDDIRFNGDGQIIRGREAIEASLQSPVPAAEYRFTLDVEQVRFLSPTIALADATYGGNFDGYALYVLVKDDSRWLIKAARVASQPPPGQ